MQSSKSWGSKTARDHHTTTPMFDSCYDVPFLKCCVSFMADVTRLRLSKFQTYTFCLVSPQNIFPKDSGDHRYYFKAIVRQAFVVSLSYCWIMNADLNWDIWSLQFFNLVLGSFVISWMSQRCGLGVILVGRSLLGRFTTVLSFLHLCTMCHTVVHWSAKALHPYIWLWTVYRLIGVSDFVSQVFL